MVLTPNPPTSHKQHATLHSSPDTSRPELGVWFVFEAEHGKLDRALQTLSGFEFDTYVPKLPVRVRETVNGKRNSQFTNVLRPMFFGFGFVMSPVERVGLIRHEVGNGIRRLLSGTTGRPQRVEMGFVERLIADQDRREMVPEKASPKCCAGASVLVVRGPFAGHVVEVESCDGYTTVVWLSVFGGRTKATLSRQDVSAE